MRPEYARGSARPRRRHRPSRRHPEYGRVHHWRAPYHPSEPIARAGIDPPGPAHFQLLPGAYGSVEARYRNDGTTEAGSATKLTKQDPKWYTIPTLGMSFFDGKLDSSLTYYFTAPITNWNLSIKKVETTLPRS